jgi:hypothetical protein
MAYVVFIPHGFLIMPRGWRLGVLGEREGVRRKQILGLSLQGLGNMADHLSVDRFEDLPG